MFCETADSSFDSYRAGTILPGVTVRRLGSSATRASCPCLTHRIWPVCLRSLRFVE
jgi:hypothetical protein